MLLGINQCLRSGTEKCSAEKIAIKQPDRPQESCVFNHSSYADSGRHNAYSFSACANEISGFSVRLRRLGTVGIYPFQFACDFYVFSQCSIFLRRMQCSYEKYVVFYFFLCYNAIAVRGNR